VDKNEICVGVNSLFKKSYDNLLTNAKSSRLVFTLGPRPLVPRAGVRRVLLSVRNSFIGQAGSSWKARPLAILSMKPKFTRLKKFRELPEKDNCPHCGVNLIGAEIPAEDRHCFGKATHFRRNIGIEYPEIYDGILHWRCPDCSGEWARFE